MEWDDRGSPFDEVRLIPAEQAVDFVLKDVANLTVQFRRTFFAGVKGAFSTPPPPGPVRKPDDTTTSKEQ